MSRSSSRPFRTAYFFTQGLARACHAASWHLLTSHYRVAVVYDGFGARSTTLTRHGRQITITGLLP